MIQLSPSQYSLARPFLIPLQYHLAVRSLLAGKLPASIYLDDLNHPGLALAWTRKRVYLAGEIPNQDTIDQVRRLLVDQITPQVKAAELPVLVLYYAPSAWGIVLEKMFSAKPLSEATREHYIHDTLPANWQNWIPEGMRLQVVDADFLHCSHLKNMDLLVEEIQSEGEPLERFAADRLGICALSVDEITGWCLSEYNLEGCCEIGIETLEPYQRRGLGSAMTCAFVELAHSRGIEHIGWDCYHDNLPSVATARKAGFTLEVAYPSLVCWLTNEGIS
jgi:RimJ/RimL family protein N-acetyltransferase